TTVEEVLEVADRLLEKDEEVTVNRAFEKEDESIVSSYVESHLPVATPVFALGFKENFFKDGECTLEEEVGMALLLDVLAGQMSPIYKELLEAGLINDTFSTEFFNGHDYAAVLLSGESNNPQLVSEKIKERIKELRSKGISPEQFEIARKKYYGKTVRAFSDIDTVANSLIMSHFLNEELFSEFEVVKNIKVEFVNELLNKCFNEEKAVLSVIKE
ncbi:MAG: insulinase family protein, partial [Acutalibacteraceae bacterium]